MKLKKCLKKNLRKNFINLNNAFYFSLMLFIIKANEKFCFYIDYRKLNVIIKRNNSFIFLIDETLVKLIECKYITKLNIIAVFNKFRMHSESENLIIFIRLFKVYKYYVLFILFYQQFV